MIARSVRIRGVQIGSDLAPPSMTMEGKILSLMREQLPWVDWEVVSLRVSGESKAGPDFFRTIVGLRRGPMWLRRLSYLPSFVIAVALSLKANPQLVHIAWVGHPLLVRSVIRVAHSVGAAVMVTVLDRRTSPRSIMAADLILVHSEGTYHYYSEAFQDSSKLLFRPPPIDLQRFRPVAGETKDEVLILSGPRSPAQMAWRGTFLALEAGRILGRRGSPVEIVLLNRWMGGHDVLDSAVDACAPTNFRIEHGHVTNVEVRIARSLAVLVPFLEGAPGDVPLSAIEAWACGRPVIATVGLGLDEYMDSGIGGLLVPPDPAQLADAIESIWASPGDWTSNAITLAQRFDERAFVEEITHATRELLGQ